MYMEIINLNAGVKIQDLYKDSGLEQEVLDKIEELGKDGFDEDELVEIKNMGADVDLITKNSTAAEGADGEKADTKAAAKKTDADVNETVKDIKDKYCKDLAALQGDAYSSKNPELMALGEAMNDGLLNDLRAEGFTKSQILSIINEAFPSVGIKENENGGYTLPYGHDAEAKAIYNKFQTQLFNVSTGSSADVEKAQATIADLNNKIRQNNNQLQMLEAEITSLQAEIEERIEQDIEESEDIADDARSSTQSAISKHLNNYINANGEMSYEDFEKGLTSDLNKIDNRAEGKLAVVVLHMLGTERKMGALRDCLDSMKTLNDANKDLSDQIKDAQDNMNKALSEQELNKSVPDGSDSDCQRTDPIGFTDKAGNRYDFFIDKDNNGDISNEKEFLGAEKGFDEVKKMDDGDGILTKQEMVDAGMMVVVTKADGTQEIKSAAEVFGDSDTIDINSYEGRNQKMENGNELLGTFDVNFDGEKLDTGYQTLDSNEWLDANYNFTDEDMGIGRHAKDEYVGEEVLDFTDQMAEHEAKYEQFKTDMNVAWKNVGTEKADDLRDEIREAKHTDGERVAKIYEKRFEAIEEANLAKKEEAKAADEAEMKEAMEAMEADYAARHAEDAEPAAEAEEVPVDADAVVPAEGEEVPADVEELIDNPLEEEIDPE